MIRPTARAVTFFALSLPVSWLLFSYAFALWPVALYGSSLVLLAIANDCLFVLPRHLIKASLDGPAQCFLGESIDVIVELRTPRHRQPRYIELQFEIEEVSGLKSVTERVQLSDDGVSRGSTRIQPRVRGVVRIPRVTLTWQGRLKLVTQSLHIPFAYHVNVLPNVRVASKAALEFFARESLFGLRVQREKGEGAEFEALRSYTAGLDSRQIDWKHSARHRSLLCKEFRAERNHNVVMAFDTGYVMQEQIRGLARLDHAINAALLLAWVALRSGDLIGSFAFDSKVRQYSAPARGARAYAQLQRAAVDLPYTQLETNFTLGLTDLQSRLRRRSLIVMLTEFVDTVTAELMIDNVQRLSRQHVVICATLRDPQLSETIDMPPNDMEQVARSLVAFELNRERSVVLERLRRVGIHCIDVDATQLSIAILNRYLLIKQRALI